MLRNISALTTALAMFVPSAGRGQTLQTLAGARQFRGEQDLTVSVTFGLGELVLTREQGEVLYRANVVYDADKFEPRLEYTPGARRLDVGIESNDDLRLRNLRNLEQRIDLTVTPLVPTSFLLQFGAGRANVDLGGMRVKRVELQTGASETSLRFSRPTSQPCERLQVEIGAAEFRAEQLGNSNCDAMAFAGAAGSLTLDFTGEWQHTGVTNAEVTLGLGGLTLQFPSSLGVSVALSRFLASFDRRGFVRRGDRYVSANYDDAPAKLRLDLQAIVGDVDVVWVP